MATKARIAHTPGPWLVERNTVYGYGDNWTTLAQTDLCSGLPEAECRANAALIAAAPDLLAAAQAVLYHDERGQGTGYSEAMNALKAAIAKAGAQ